jgi:hypothetical protein
MIVQILGELLLAGVSLTAVSLWFANKIHQRMVDDLNVDDENPKPALNSKMESLLHERAIVERIAQDHRLYSDEREVALKRLKEITNEMSKS